MCVGVGEGRLLANDSTKEGCLTYLGEVGRRNNLGRLPGGGDIQPKLEQEANRVRMGIGGRREPDLFLGGGRDHQLWPCSQRRGATVGH